jgi:prepilin-type N-terminal cleavage/methylation domain-containing protein
MKIVSGPQKKGFTLLEILLVIAAIGILAAIVLIAINPNRQLAQARNAQRQSDVLTISNAVYQYLIDNNALPAGIDTTLRNVASTDGTTTCTIVGEVAEATDVSDFVTTVTTPVSYVAAIPRDPQVASAGCSDYLIQTVAGNRVTVSAPGAELSEDISVTR